MRDPRDKIEFGNPHDDMHVVDASAWRVLAALTLVVAALALLIPYNFVSR